MLDSRAARWTGIAVASATGYFAIGRLYRHIRGRCEPGSDDQWVCPGVGAAGALTAGGVAAYLISSNIGQGGKVQQAPRCPALGDGSTTIGLPNFSLSN